MFTKNWYKLIAAKISGDYANFVFTKIDGNIVSKSSISGDILISVEGSYYSTPSMVRMQASSGKSGVVIGTGNTPPTLDDYKLSGDTISTFEYSTIITKETDETGTTVSAVYTITNTGDSEFTIREIGIYADPIANAGSNFCLFERTVLESPVTIPAGGVGQTTYTIRMNYPAI